MAKWLSLLYQWLSDVVLWPFLGDGHNRINSMLPIS